MDLRKAIRWLRGDGLDRDEAIRWLRGGPDGIREWNRRRERDEEIPSLRGADLSVAHVIEADLRGAVLSLADLSGADLSLADLSLADLSKADLSGADLSGADLSGADLSGAVLIEADLSGAVLIEADLSGAVLRVAGLRVANLRGANLSGANLREADLNEADLSEANLSGADLSGAYLHGADLIKAVFSEVRCRYTVFGEVDLSEVKGLETIRHDAPSTIGVDTLIRSRGRIPEAFLRGCGFTPWEVLAATLYQPELNPPGFVDLQYRILDAWTKGQSMINGCFISYSWKDAKFVDKLRDHLVAEGVNVWLDRHDMVAGPIQDQVWRAIQVHHVVILVLSEASVKSDWVENELDMARRKEKAEKRAVLCPIRLDDAWEAKIAAEDTPGDPERKLWRTLAQKLVVDFRDQEPAAFEEAFQKLLRGLRLYYGPGASGSS
jgi:uncharacterized protein YjbI with pentapeptide repeats